MNPELRTFLTNLGFSDEMIANLENQGVMNLDDIRLFSAHDISITAKCNMVLALKAYQALAPVSVPVVPEVVTPVEAAPAGSTAGGDEIPEGTTPTPNQINAAAASFGMDPSMLTMFMFANMGGAAGLDMDMSSMLPIPQIVGGYNPKLRNMSYMVMGQIERRLDTPIVVINADGSVNPELTVKYIMSLEEGFSPASDGVFYNDDGSPFEVIRVGVDAQGIYDADPVDSSKALQKNGMGKGRIMWNGVPLEVRQVVYFAARQTHELDSNDPSAMARLRDKITPTTTRLSLRGDFPQAIAAYNSALRTGSLPTLRVQLSRSPRKSEVMPRRRISSGPRDLSDTGFPRVVGDPESAGNIGN